jgi:hypothetical protein
MWEIGETPCAGVKKLTHGTKKKKLSQEYDVTDTGSFQEQNRPGLLVHGADMSAFPRDENF